MDFRYLGKSDLKVSSYCLGTMTYGETTEENDAHLQISEAFSSGINFIDTAEMYPTCPIRKETTGETEKIIGNWINNNRDKRKDIILATKVVGNGFKYIRDGGPITKDTIKEALQGSLKRLKTDYIDLYQLHWPNRGSYHFRSYWNYKPKKQENKNITDEFLDIVNTLNEFKKEGLIRAIGVSNETCWGVMNDVYSYTETDGEQTEAFEWDYEKMKNMTSKELWKIFSDWTEISWDRMSDRSYYIDARPMEIQA